MGESWLCSERPGPDREDGACERDSDRQIEQPGAALAAYSTRINVHRTSAGQVCLHLLTPGPVVVNHGPPPVVIDGL